MLSASDLAAMREAQDAALPDTCTIRRKTLVSDGMGGYTETWSDLATGVKCRIATSRYRPEEAAIAEKFTGRTLWMLTLPAGTDVTNEDRVVLSGTTYEVVGVLSAGSWEMCRRVLVVEVS